MKKLLTCLVVLLSCGICFVDQSAGDCNCNDSSTQSNIQEQNGKIKIVNNSSKTYQSAKIDPKKKEEDLLKKELQELQEFLERSKEENSEKTENSK